MPISLLLSNQRRLDHIVAKYPSSVISHPLKVKFVLRV